MNKQKLLFVPALLTSLSQGKLLTNIFFYGTRAFAVLLGLGAALAWISAWKLVKDESAPIVLGVILFQATFLIAAYATVHVIWIRADDMRTGADERYKITPIVAVFSRMVAEAGALCTAILGLGGAVAMLLAGNIIKGAIPGFGGGYGHGYNSYEGGNNFIEAVMFLVTMLGGAIGILAVGYLLAELTLVLVDIARNTRAKQAAVSTEAA